MTDLERLREALAKKWLAEHGADGMERAVQALRGGIKTTRTRRLKTLKWAWQMRLLFDKARDEIGEHAKNDQTLCDWLNNYRDENGLPVRTIQNGHFIPRTLHDLHGVAHRYAEDLVLECRTKMSARAMSADFKLRTIVQDTLEAEAVRKLVPVIGLVCRLQGLPIPPRAERREEARLLMIEVAKQQRQSQYAPMLAREAYLSDDEFDIMAPAFRDDDGFWKLVERMRAAQ